MASAIAVSTWMRLGGRGGGPMVPMGLSDDTCADAALPTTISTRFSHDSHLLLGSELCLLRPLAKFSVPACCSSGSSSSTTASSVLTASLPLPFLTRFTPASPELRLPLRKRLVTLKRPLFCFAWP
jgi:hypothetical protein